MTPEQRFERIEAILQVMAERSDRMEIRFNERFEKAERRMDRLEKQAKDAEKRMAKFDRQLLATKRLVDTGMKIVVQLAKGQREFEKSQKAFLDSLRGHNGNGHPKN